MTSYLRRLGTIGVKKMDTNLPEPECSCGYPAYQLKEVLGDRLPAFWQWMRGQTVTLCEGKRYNHDTKEYEEDCGGISHGAVVYTCDLERYLLGLPVID